MSNRISTKARQELDDFLETCISTKDSCLVRLDMAFQVEMRCIQYVRLPQCSFVVTGFLFELASRYLVAEAFYSVML